MGNCKELQKKVTGLLLDGRLKQAMDILAGVITSDTDWDLYTRFTEIQTAYGYMLEYLRMGMPDPNRESLHRELIGKCLIINDRYATICDTQNTPSIYMQHRRMYHNRPETATIRGKLAENAANISVAQMMPHTESNDTRRSLLQQHEHIIHEAFNRLWTSTGWSSNDIEEISALLDDNSIGINDRATLVSAITIGTLKCFEPDKALLLCRLTTHRDTSIAIRALIGAILVLSQYQERIEYYPELPAALQSLNESNNAASRIRTIQIQLLRSRETQKINRKMREEIIPAMMKNPHLRNEKLGMDIIQEIDEDEQNPEWKAWLEQDNIKSKLDEMAKWQIEGADVYMSTFSQLKRFPFFEEITNWFRPFDTNVPQIDDIMPKNTTASKTMLGAICSSQFFCNSDKYSFCLTLCQTPPEQREMLMQQITNGGDDITDTVTALPDEKTAEATGNQYIQDLYRFFKLAKHRREFPDPFALSLNLLENRYLSPLLDHPESILQTFHYLVEKQYHTEAYHAGRLYEEKYVSNGCDGQFYQKMGYCMQKQQEYNSAIDYYTKADIVHPDSLWTMRHIAQCYRLTGDFNNALHYYMAAEEIAPDNLRLLLQTAECLATLKRYDEAFARFFKVEYLEKEPIRPWRAIAWCSFLTAKDEQAQRYYEKILKHPKATHEDFINAAHTEWIIGNRNRAYELYKKALTMCRETNEFFSIFDKDKTALKERGATDFELMLLRDLLY